MMQIGRWLRQLRVGQKISFGYGLALGVAIVGTTAGILLANYYQHQAHEQEEDALAELELINRLQIETLQVRAHRQEFIAFVSQPKQYLSILSLSSTMTISSKLGLSLGIR